MPFWKRKPKDADKAPTVRPEEQTVEPVHESHAPTRLLSYRIANLQGVGARPRQEDSFTFVNAMDVVKMRDEGLLAILADGMGGMQDGKAASEAAIASMRADFQKLDRSGNIPQQLCRMIDHAGDCVLSMLGGAGGSTAVVCLFYEEKLWFACIGDSALFLLRDGELCRLNREHNVRNERYLASIRAGSMDPSFGREDREGHALTQFIGMQGMDEADFLLKPLPLHDGDRILLCSDGVADMVPGPALRACMEASAPQEVCDKIEQAVLAANNPYQDNYTALYVQCGY